MARIRAVKPEMPSSPQVMNLSIHARWLFLGLILQADDEGRGVADPRKLKAAIFPGDDGIASKRVVELLAEVERERLIVTYDGGDHGRVYCLPSWHDHQALDRPRPSVYPPPPIDSSNTRRALVEDPSNTLRGSNRIEPRRDEAKRSESSRGESAEPSPSPTPQAAPAPAPREEPEPVVGIGDAITARTNAELARLEHDPEVQRKRRQARELVEQLARQKAVK